MSLEKYAGVIGSVPDEKVAEMAGVTLEEVLAFRAEAGDGADVDGGDDHGASTPSPKEAGPATEPPKPEAEPAPKPKPRRRARKPAVSKPAKAQKAPVEPEPEPVPAVHAAVRITGNRVVKGPTGRRLRLSFRDVFSGDMALWLQERHPALCEPYPPKA